MNSLRFPFPRAVASFTLVEVLTATSVLSILSVIMFGILQQTSKGWQAANRRVESVQAVRLALDQISSDLENTLVVVRTNVSLPITNFPTAPTNLAALTNRTTNYAFGFVHVNNPRALPPGISANRSRINMPPGSDSIHVTTLYPPSLGQGANVSGSDLCEVGYFPVYVSDPGGYSTMRGLRYYLLRHLPLTNRSGSDVFYPLNDFTNSTGWENTPAEISTVNRLPVIDNCLAFDVRFLSGPAGGTLTNSTNWPRPTNPANWPGLPRAAILTVCVVDERTAERLARWFPGGLDESTLSNVLVSVTNPAILNTISDRPPGLRATLREGVVGFQRMIYFKNAAP